MYQKPVWAPETMKQSTRQDHKGEAPWICGQENARIIARKNTAQNTKDITGPMIDITISDPAVPRIEPRPRAADSTDDAAVMDCFDFQVYESILDRFIS